MKRNIEIKAEVTDLGKVERCVRSLADEGPVVLEQEDTFFCCPHGRLKLRRFADAGPGELIAYSRPDASGPKESRYTIHRTDDPGSLCEALTQTLGLRGVVRKRRTLYRIGQTRVHLDQVEGLGDFVELEVVLREEQDLEQAASIARGLMQKLGITEDRLLDSAYIDMLEAQRSP